MALADTFQEIVDSLPTDWTDLELDLRIFDEDRYIDAATLPRRRSTRSPTRTTTGTGACSSPTVRPRRRRAAAHGTLKLLDDAGIDGELAVREVRTGRVEVDADVGAARSPCARSSAARRSQ